jgi:hypothetical protein
MFMHLEMKLFKCLAKLLSWKRGIVAATGALRAEGEFRGEMNGSEKNARL